MIIPWPVCPGSGWYPDGSSTRSTANSDVLPLIVLPCMLMFIDTMTLMYVATLLGGLLELPGSVVQVVPVTWLAKPLKLAGALNSARDMARLLAIEAMAATAYWPLWHRARFAWHAGSRRRALAHLRGSSAGH